jgi:hypothetical protein
MKLPGATKEERLELERWMTAAFKKYTTARATSGLSILPDETPKQHQARIEAYGHAFGCVILGKIEMNEITKLLDDLQHLLKSNCPALDLVELMLLCTEDFSMSIPDLLFRVGIRKNDLAALQRTLNRTAHTVKVLNQPALPMPLDYIEEKFPDMREQRRVRELIEALPDALRYMSVLLDGYPPEPDQATAADRDHFALGLFYLLVNHYGLGYPTLSHLLKAMRCARQAISQAGGPQGHRRRGNELHRIDEGKEKKDPLSEFAITRRLARYWRAIGRARKLDMLAQVTMYAEFSSYKKLRRRGETLISLLVRLEQDWDANAPRIGAMLAAEKEKDK